MLAPNSTTTTHRHPLTPSELSLFWAWGGVDICSRFSVDLPRAGCFASPDFGTTQLQQSPPSNPPGGVLQLRWPALFFWVQPKFFQSTKLFGTKWTKLCQKWYFLSFVLSFTCWPHVVGYAHLFKLFFLLVFFLQLSYLCFCCPNSEGAASSPLGGLAGQGGGLP